MDRFGFCASKSLIVSLTSLLMAISDSVCVLLRLSPIVSSPLYLPMLLFSSRLSDTVARSRKYKVFPVPVRSGKFFSFSIVE